MWLPKDTAMVGFFSSESFNLIAFHIYIGNQIIINRHESNYIIGRNFACPSMYIVFTAFIFSLPVLNMYG